MATSTAKTSGAPRHKKQRKVARPAKIHFFVVAARGNCWMEVRNYSAGGKTLYTGTLQYRQHLGPLVARRLWINFGSPSNIKVVVNHRVVRIPGGGASVTVLVTRAGIVRAPAGA